MRYHFTTTRMAILKKIQKTRSVGKGVGKLKSSYIACVNVKCYSHGGKQFAFSSKSKTQNYSTTQQFSP